MFNNTKLRDALRELNEEMDAIQESVCKIETLSDSLNATTDGTVTMIGEDLPSHQQFRDWREALSLLIDCEEADGYITPKGCSNAVRGLEGLDDFLGKFQGAT